MDARDGKIVCFFQSADKFGARYATFGFNDSALLDDGAMYPAEVVLTLASVSIAPSQFTPRIASSAPRVTGWR